MRRGEAKRADSRADEAERQSARTFKSRGRRNGWRRKRRRFCARCGSRCRKRQGALDARQAALELLSPYAALKRGYAIVQKEGGAVAKAALLRTGDEVSIRFADGVIRARVWSEEEEHGQKADV